MKYPITLALILWATPTFAALPMSFESIDLQALSEQAVKAQACAENIDEQQLNALQKKKRCRQARN